MSHLTDEALLEQLEARQALHTLNAQFARALDRMDRCLMVSLWTQDAHIDWGKHQGPVQAFVMEATTARDDLERSFTTLSNAVFNLNGMQACGEIYVLNVSTVIENGSKVERFLGGRFLDQYRCEQGQWKIAQRTFVMDWNMTQPCTAIWDEGLFGLITLRGRRDDQDPVYQLMGA